MSSDSQIVAAFIGLVGIGIGGLFGGVGFYLKTRAEDKKKAKRALFNLLEIWHALRLSKADPKKLSNEYLLHANRLMQEKFNIPMGDESCEGLLHEFIESTVSKNNHNSMENMGEQYRICINDLAECWPVLAFQLNGREQLHNYLADIEKYNDGISTLAAEDDTHDEKATQLLESIQYNMKIEGVDELLTSLESDINDVAKKAGVFSKIASSKKLKQLKKMNIESVDTDEVEAMLDRIVGNLRTISIEQAKVGNCPTLSLYPRQYKSIAKCIANQTTTPIDHHPQFTHYKQKKPLHINSGRAFSIWRPQGDSPTTSSVSRRLLRRLPSARFCGSDQWPLF